MYRLIKFIYIKVEKYILKKKIDFKIKLSDIF